MDSNCRKHGQKIESINEKGEPLCIICFEETNQILLEYKEKKKTLMKKKQEEILEKLRQSKKKMVEVQENLILKMKSHLEAMDKKRESLNGFFSVQENRIEQYLDQQKDFLTFKNNNRSFNAKNSNDSTLKQVEEEFENIYLFQKEFEEILQQAKTDYINSVTSIIQQQGQQQQQLITLPQEKITYQDFLSWSGSNTKLDQILINRDNSILAHSDGFEIKFFRIQQELLLKINNSIEDDDMQLIQCIIFGQSNDDIYYGTDDGKLKIWKNQDDTWSNVKTIEAHDHKEIVDLKIIDNDSRLFSAGGDKLIKIWKKAGSNNWIVVKTFDNTDFSQMCSIAIDTVSQKLISCSFTQVKIWNMNDINSGYVLGGLEPNKNNKVYFINDQMFFVTSTDKVYFYEKNDEEKFIQIQRNILPQNKQYNLPFCYNQELKIFILQNTQAQNVEILRFNEGKFDHQSSIQGIYHNILIARDAMYLVLVPKNETKSLKMMRLQ
ncbi:unnamed protein product [Paramecium primaurelia]|uniref:WD40-repeat-containing domain n=1 Tax=Paramecium primaurelia TaxID=5886 RepID=A0A8S1KJZ7_PARPR|nr:unnamed protein product [Paramecium primaurelia]